MNKISNWKTLCFRLKYWVWSNEIIRIKERKSNGDHSFIDIRCNLIGITTEGRISISKTSWSGKKDYFELEQNWNDGLWYSTRILNHSETQWNKFIGKSIRTLPNTVLDRSFEDNKTFEYPILMNASKHHLVLNWNNHECILDYRWVNPEIWEIVK